MRKTKYNFDPELKKYENLNPPIITFMLPLMQKLMGVLYRLEKSDSEVNIEQIKIPVGDGQSIRALIYTPVNVIKNSPCLVFFHGGGFVYQAAPHHFVLARKLAKALNVRTLFVDYRKSPKYKFPTAPEDAYDAYTWLLNNVDKLDVDKQRIALIGDSAGANLSAALCLMARDRGVQLPCTQVLIYPYVDRNMKAESMKEFIDTPMCNKRAVKKFQELYFPYKDHEHVEYFSQVEAPSLEGLPPAYVEIAEFDCLRDGGLLYVRLLKEAGVQVELHETRATMHGYDIAVDSNIVKNLMAKRVTFLKKVLFP